MMGPKPYKPALLVVDFQEDFCPPNGSLAVPGGRDIASTVNHLLSLPFVIRLATRDFHPENHISFAANHEGKEPFKSKATVFHPTDTSVKYDITLWPVHCVQGTAGAELVPELDQSRLDGVVKKGKTEFLEMYSAFYDPFEIEDSGIRQQLADRDVTHVFVVGLAAEYCVKSTAIDAAQEGYETYLVEEGTRPVDSETWEQAKKELAEKGVKLVSVDGEEVARVSGLRR